MSLVFLINLLNVIVVVSDILLFTDVFGFLTDRYCRSTRKFIIHEGVIIRKRASPIVCCYFLVNFLHYYLSDPVI